MDTILLEDNIWEKFFLSKSMTIIKELDIYKRYFPFEKKVEVKWLDQLDDGGIPLINGYKVFNWFCGLNLLFFLLILLFLLNELFDEFIFDWLS